VSQKTVKIVFFCQNFVKVPPTLILFGTKMVKTIELRMVHSFTTSPNLCQCTTMWNTDAPSSKLLHYTVVICILLLTFASSIQQRVPRGLVILWY